MQLIWDENTWINRHDPREIGLKFRSTCWSPWVRCIQRSRNLYVFGLTLSRYPEIQGKSSKDLTDILRTFLSARSFLFYWTRRFLDRVMLGYHKWHPRVSIFLFLKVTFGGKTDFYALGSRFVRIHVLSNNIKRFRLADRFFGPQSLGQCFSASCEQARPILPFPRRWLWYITFMKKSGHSGISAASPSCRLDPWVSRIFSERWCIKVTV